MFLQHDLLTGRAAGGCGARREGLFQAVQPDGGLLHPRHGAGPHRRAGRAGPRRARCATTRAPSPSCAAKRSTRRSPTSRAASCASTLANGMRVAVLSKKTANNIVTGTIELRFGDQTSLANQREAASFAGSLLMAGTKTPHAPAAPGGAAEAECAGQRQRRRWRWRRRRRGGGGGGGMSSATATITAPAENFLAAVRLAVEILKEPAYPQDEFDRIKTQRAEGARGGADRAEPAGDRAAEPAPESVREGRRAVRADARRAVAGAPESRRSTTPGSSTISSTARTTACSRWSGRSTPADVQKAAADAARRLEYDQGLQAARHAVQEGGADQREDRDARQGQRAVHGGRAVPDVAERSRLSGDRPGQLHVRRADHVAHLRSHSQSRRPELRRERADHGARGRRFRDAVRHREPQSRRRPEGRVQLHRRAEEGVPGWASRRRKWPKRRRPTWTRG